MPLKKVSYWSCIADEDVEDLLPANNVPGKSSGTVLPFVGVACLGATLFGYHLGYGFSYSFYSADNWIYTAAYLESVLPSKLYEWFALHLNWVIFIFIILFPFGKLWQCPVSCRVVNGALEYLAKDLGITENTVLQGAPFFFIVAN